MSDKHATAPKFLLATATVVGLVCGVGYWPTVRLAGPGSAAAVAVGAGAGLIASWIGTAPVFLARPGAGNVASLVLAATALRSFVALALALALGLTGWWHLAPVLIWVALSYVVLLPVDVAFAIGRIRMKTGESRKANARPKA